MRPELKDLAARAIAVATRTQKDLADALGVSHDLVRQWRIRRSAPASRELVLRLADELDAQADQLRGLAVELRRLVD